MTGPQVVNKQSIHQVSPDNWYKNSKGETSVKVDNLSCVIFINEEAISVTQFKGGQSIQRLLVYGDGFTTLVHSSLLVLANNENKLLAADSLYEFAYVNGAWRELESLSSGGGGGGGGIITQFSHIAGEYISGASFNGSVTVTWSVSATPNNEPNTIVARDANGNFSANIITARIAALNVMPGSFALGNYRIPNDLTIGEDLLVQTSGLVLGGFNSLGSGTDSTRIGPDADATGLNGIAIGDTALASTGIRIGAGGPTANGALIIGQNPSVTGTQTTFRDSLISIGHNNVQNDSVGVATGDGNIVIGNNFPGVAFSPLEQSAIGIGHDILNIGRDDIVIGHNAQSAGGNFATHNVLVGHSNSVSGNSSGSNVLVGGFNTLSGPTDKIVIGTGNLAPNRCIILGSGVTTSGDGQVFLGGPTKVMTELWFGRGQSIASTGAENKFIRFTGRTGTNQRAGDVYFDGPLGTGSGASSDFIFRTSTLLTPGTTVQTWDERFRIRYEGVKVTGQLEVTEGTTFGDSITVTGPFIASGAVELGGAPSPVTPTITFLLVGSTGTLVGAPGNYTITKTGSFDNFWTLKCNSSEPIANQARVDATASLTNEYRFFGLSVTPETSYPYDQFPDYYIYPQATGIFSWGSRVGGELGTDTYLSTTVFSIVYSGTTVEFYKDGVLLDTLVVAAGLTLYFDSSYYGIGAKLSAVSFYDPTLLSGDIEFVGMIISDILVKTTNLYDIGATALRFKDGWFDGTVTADIFDADTQYNVASTKVVGAQQAAIADAIGGTEIATINAILAAMRTHGLIAT